MKYKKFVIPTAAFLLGCLVTNMSITSISDVSGYTPSYFEPLSEEAFVESQQTGVANFSGSPTPGRNQSDIAESAITCYRDDMICEFISARIISYTSGPLLAPSAYKYKINEWSEEGVIKAAYADDPCGLFTLDANVKSREVSIGYEPVADSAVDQSSCTAVPGQTKLGLLRSNGIFSGIKSELHYWVANY